MKKTINYTLSCAAISSCTKFRYSLIRQWNPNLPRIAFIMLNPSTANATTDDPTIRRCREFASSWGYGSMEIVNLFAFRATKPDAMFMAHRDAAADIVGPENDAYIKKAIRDADITVLAWGANGHALDRDRIVSRFLPIAYCLETTGHGHPKHPLYIKANTQPKLVAFNETSRKFIIPDDEHKRPLPASLILKDGGMVVVADELS